MTVWEWDAKAAAFIRVAGSTEAAAGSRLLVADSWFVSDGRVRAFARHRERFARACGATVAGARPPAGPGPAAVAESVSGEDFWAALLDLVPRQGEWFPRVELVMGGESAVAAASPRLLFRLRRAPARGDTVVVWVPGSVDPREQPGIKGPDLEALGRLRQDGREHGADEALLTDARGHVVETANSNLLWWEGGTLCAPDPGLGVFPGVTAGLLADEARRQGIPVESRRVHLDAIAQHEVWLTNALHGLRTVTGWTADTAVPSVSCGGGHRPAGRFARWNRWLEDLARDPGVPEGATSW